MVFNAKPCVEFPVSGIIKLLPIINNNDLRDTKSADDRLPGEVPDIFLYDSR